MTRMATERRRLQTDAVSGSLWITLQTVLGLPLAVVANAVVAHALGAESYGTLAVYLAAYALVVSVLNAGISDATVQWISAHNARGERPELLAAIRRCSGYHVMIEAPLVGVLAAVLLRHSGMGSMLAGAAAAIVTMVLGTSTVVMSGLGMNGLAARLSLAFTLATQTALIATVSLSPVPASVFVARLTVLSLGPAAALLLLAKDVRHAVLRPLLPAGWPPGFLAFAFRTAGSAVVSTLVFSRSELFVFKAYGLATQAGLFALSAGVAGLITAPIDSLLNPLLPAATGLLTTSPERAGAALLRGLRTSTLFAGLVAAVGIPVLTPLLPLIYGGSFGAAATAFVVLAVVSCVQSTGHPVTAFLLAGRLTGVLLRVSVLAVVIDLGLAVALIPLIGVPGAVIASTLAQFTVLLVSARRVGLLLGVRASSQLGAMSFFIDALVVAAVAGGVEVAVGGPAALRGIIGLLVAFTALALAGRVHPSSGLTRADVSVIAGGLPRPFRSWFVWSVRIFSLERKSSAER